MEINSENDNFMKPEQFKEKLTELNGSVQFLLDEFKKIYVLSRLHPSNQEYQQQYANMIGGLNQIHSKLFTTSSDVQLNIDKLNKAMIALNIQIQKEKEKNKELKKKLGFVENKSSAASEMISDYNQIYDERYLRNWALGLSTLICIVAISKLFKNPGV